MTPDELREATRWCREHQAKVTWSEDETRCVVEVPVDGREPVCGEGGDYFHAYVHCRMLLEASSSDDPPTKKFRCSE